MEQFQKIVQRTIEYFRLFHVRHMRGVFDNFQTRVANPIMHELCVGNWPDRILTADDDECGHVNARKSVGVIPPRGHAALGPGRTLWISTQDHFAHAPGYIWFLSERTRR